MKGPAGTGTLNGRADRRWPKNSVDCCRQYSIIWLWDNIAPKLQIRLRNLPSITFSASAVECSPSICRSG